MYAIAKQERYEALDKQEFEIRVMAQADRMHRVAISILGREADCEDATQDAVIHAWTHVQQLRNPQYFETWLIRILVNECKHTLRKRPHHLPDTALAGIPAAQPPNRALWKALRRVDSRYRLPLTLHHVEGYTVKQVSSILSLPQSTVKWRIHQGKKALSIKLEEEEQP